MDWAGNRATTTDRPAGEVIVRSSAVTPRGPTEATVQPGVATGGIVVGMITGGIVNGVVVGKTASVVLGARPEALWPHDAAARATAANPAAAALSRTLSARRVERRRPPTPRRRPHRDR